MTLAAPDLLALHLDPAAAGRQATARRSRAFGDAIWIRELDPTPSVPPPWPETASPGAVLLLHVDPSADGRADFARWLVTAGAALPAEVAVAPYSTEPAGLHRLWCLAAARIALPLHVRIQVRHDVVGIRLAQVALGFGADTFGGPLRGDRKLPIAGVTRPNEATPTGIATLIRAAGLRPVQTPQPPADKRAAS